MRYDDTYDARTHHPPLEYTLANAKSDTGELGNSCASRYLSLKNAKHWVTTVGRDLLGMLSDTHRGFIHRLTSLIDLYCGKDLYLTNGHSFSQVRLYERWVSSTEHLWPHQVLSDAMFAVWKYSLASLQSWSFYQHNPERCKDRRPTDPYSSSQSICDQLQAVFSSHLTYLPSRDGRQWCLIPWHDALVTEPLLLSIVIEWEGCFDRRPP